MVDEFTTERFSEVGKHLAAIDVAILKVANSLELLTRLDERFMAHEREDDKVHAVVTLQTENMTNLSARVAPLIEMRKWIVAAVVGILGILSTAIVSAYFTYNTALRAADAALAAARALPVAAARVEQQMAVPPEQRQAVIKEQENKEVKAH